MYVSPAVIATGDVRVTVRHPVPLPTTFPYRAWLPAEDQRATVCGPVLPGPA